MRLKRVLQYAHVLLEDVLTEGDTAIDATAGNGHDTAFLANLIGSSGRVYSFDIQQQAIESTTRRVKEQDLLDRCEIIHDGHENIASYVEGSIKAAIFNLGYLPGGEHHVVTQPNTTIIALTTIIEKLEVGGIAVIVIYYGHDGGKKERDAVIQYASSLSQKTVNVLRYEFINQKNEAPFIIAIEKIKEMM